MLEEGQKTVKYDFINAMAEDAVFIVTPRPGEAVKVIAVEAFFCDHPVDVGEFPIAEPLNFLLSSSAAMFEKPL